MWNALLSRIFDVSDREQPAPGTAPVREAWIPPGDAGARAMVDLMAKEAHKALRIPLTIRAAENIFPSGASAPHQIQALRDWLASRVSFMPDPYGVELLRTPEYMLEQIRREGVVRGDCDDVATLAAALGLAGGFPARFVLYAFGHALPFSHVFCELHTLCRGWLELDVTRPAQLPPDMEVVRVETHEV